MPSRTGQAKVLTGIWLSMREVRTSIETLLLEMLEATQPNVTLRQSVVEELDRPAKRTDVVLEYLGLRSEGLDTEGSVPLFLTAPIREKDPWREALLRPGGECPIGLLI
ncbi:MAG: hypothetical protein ACREOH_12880, partial [Candidatus Entotheonellia bacterium]